MLAPSGDGAVPHCLFLYVGICQHGTVTELTSMLAPNGDRAVPALTNFFVVKQSILIVLSP